MSELGYGIVGCGRIVRPHIEAIAQVEGARLLAVADPDENKASAAAAYAGGEVDQHSDVAVLLADPRIDVIVVCVPTQMHPEVSAAAMDAGRHVYCEKAMAANVAGCEKMIAAAERNDVRLTIGHSTRFRPPFAMARRMIEDGAIGEVVAIEGTFRCEANPAEIGATDSWRYRRESAGNGHVINFGCHYIDTARFLCDQDPVTVSAFIRNRFSAGMVQEDQFLIACECDGEALITIALHPTLDSPPAAREGFTISGTEGCLHALWRPDRIELARCGEGLEAVPIDDDLQVNPFVALHSGLREAIESGGPVPVTGADAMRNVEWGIAAYLSSEGNCRVEIPLDAEQEHYCGPQLERTIRATRD
jgi:predicted dehydrogenase